ncbi:hypothetical protein GCM10011369_07570 [Neiella marina]|uniref:Uncharacterized protein n=1 Tax=Neiella marina TaxID=508461 RepID=A0A8J2U310_9GAMM|nr:hypothetical protein [Neiella marina]GGA68403.1 hypothetical protein GCM10011369_07570 [Neiella marina]
MKCFNDAQLDMRNAYHHGAPGVLCSGLVWLIAGLVAVFSSAVAGILTLVIAGMLIFPASVLVCKLLGRTGKHFITNPLAPLAIEGTFWMLLSIPIALVLAIDQPQYFFPAMMLVIAGRYLTFRTLYGLKTFYLFSAVLVAAAFAIVAAQSPPYVAGIVGGLIEIGFAIGLFVIAKSDTTNLAIERA